MIDVIVVGAGPSGLCAAKTILQCEPTADVRIFDAQSSIGGVWAKEKIYPQLKTNTHFGGFDFSDFPMQESGDNVDEDQSVKAGQHIPGSAVHNYLCRYAKHWQLESKIQFNTKVVEVTRLGDDKTHDGAKWELALTVTHSNGPEGTQTQTQTQRCRKLIVAIGVTNAPKLPSITGSSEFAAPIIHSSDLGQQSTQIMSSPATDAVAVLGGGKSACDAVYAAAMAGKKVEWIIRKSGKGPVWIFPLETKMGPFTALRTKLPMRRIISFFSPCLWDDGFSGLRGLIHSTAVGKWIAQKFWTQLHLDTIRDCGYREDEKLRVLEPETSPFWYGTTAGAYNYSPPLFDFVKSGQVNVNRADISHLTPRTIHLADGQALAADALILATGYTGRPTISFNPPSLHSDLGIPTPSNTLSSSQQSLWHKLDAASDDVIESRFPRLIPGPFETINSTSRLKYSPGTNLEEGVNTPFRLYRCIAPPGLTSQGDRSLAFIGAFSNFANITKIELQCLWAWAYLSGQLDIDTGVEDESAETKSNMATGTNDGSSDCPEAPEDAATNTRRRKHRLSCSDSGYESEGSCSKPKTGSLASPVLRERRRHHGSGNHVFEEASLMSRYSHHRTPFGHGASFPDHVFDQLPYFDVLLRDLGLQTQRKGKGTWFGWFSEVFGAYSAADYRGFVGEWMSMRTERQ